MKNKIILAFCVFPMLLYSQARYRVFKVEGNVQQFSTATNQWVSLALRDEINADTRIKCYSRSVLTFCDSGYHVFEVRKQGEFRIGDLLSNSQINTSSEVKKAVQFFVEQTFTQGSKTNSRKSKGAVYRGDENENIFPFDSALLTGDSIPFMVQAGKGNYPVLVTIYAAGKQVFRKLMFHDTVFVLPSSLFAPGIWNHFVLGKKTYHFRWQENKNMDMPAYMELIRAEDFPSDTAYYERGFEYCFEQGYINTARLYLVYLEKHKPRMSEALIRDPRIRVLMKLNEEMPPKP